MVGPELGGGGEPDDAEVVTPLGSPLHAAVNEITAASATTASLRREPAAVVPTADPSGISEVMQTRVVDPEVMGYLVHHGDFDLLLDLLGAVTAGQHR